MQLSQPKTTLATIGVEPSRTLVASRPPSWWLAVGVAVFSVVVGAWFSAGLVRQGASGLTTTPAGTVVATVEVGSRAWLSGIRPLDPVVITVDPVTGAKSEIIDNTDPTNTSPPPDPRAVIFGSLLLAMGILSRRLGLPADALLVTLAVVLATQPLIGFATGPIAFAILPLPLLTAGFALNGWPRRVLIPVRLGLLVVIVAILAAAAMTESLGLDWRTIWSVPAFIAMAVLLTASAVNVTRETRRWRRLPDSQRTISGLVAALVPVVRRSYLRGREAERDRLAHEVHNEVLPRIRSIQALRSVGGLDDDAATELTALEADLRRLMSERQSIVLRLAGLPAALATMVDNAEHQGIPASIDAKGMADDVRLPADVEQAAYRVAAEALSNAQRHSGATEILVSVTGDAHHLQMTITDNGRGFDTTRLVRAGHLGLVEMQQWASDAGANLQIRPGALDGTEVTFRWPA